MPANPLWDQFRWRGPHPGYLGGLLDDQPVLARQPNLVAYVTNIRAYPKGFAFTACVEQAHDDGFLSPGEPHVVVGFADGRSWERDPDMLGDCLVRLRGESGAGGPGGAHWREEYWLPALPLPGPLTFFVSVGPAKWSASIDGAKVVVASTRAQESLG